MPRKRKQKDNTEARKKRIRSFRSRERREQRKQSTNAPEDLSWLIRTGVRMAAAKIMNVTHNSYMPYWLSVPIEHKQQSPDFYPSKSIVSGDRIWYGFLFREHRDEQCILWPDARKELTEGY